ncbi:hypothetical protein GGR21_001243 [Dysgonomonas hofstadii]|uniref:Uncharacterized protein n=1 Tax=Dysgonomonas hofstadii TaxID=637886 RepID=A0A840CP87_9BACT|nr:hypothetical protein [Dysgonomonas hofstadii]MBB4035354.1 hypothetical protein [Dysgonomonas hofstadii]
MYFTSSLAAGIFPSGTLFPLDHLEPSFSQDGYDLIVASTSNELLCDVASTFNSIFTFPSKTPCDHSTLDW